MVAEKGIKGKEKKCEEKGEGTKGRLRGIEEGNEKFYRCWKGERGGGGTGEMGEGVKSVNGKRELEGNGKAKRTRKRREWCGMEERESG